MTSPTVKSAAPRGESIEVTVKLENDVLLTVVFTDEGIIADGWEGDNFLGTFANTYGEFMEGVLR